MESENINITLFKEKYYSDYWQKYETESDLLETSVEKKIYWNNKLIEYQKDKINLESIDTINLAVDVNLKRPKNFLGIGFDAFFKKKIELLKIGSVKKGKDWTNEDYYNHYSETKRFGYGIVKSFEKNQYDEIKTKNSELKKLYFFTYNKLPEELKQRLYDDFNQQLEALINKQYFNSIKTLFENLKKEINTIKPQPKEANKPNEVVKDLHNHIFKDNAFEIWQSMFDGFNITQSNYSTDIDFMFEIMKYNNLIHDNIGLTDIKKWINKVYEISFEKIRYTDPKSNANRQRLAFYNEIISK